jgi:hypothetical protein
MRRVIADLPFVGTLERVDIFEGRGGPLGLAMIVIVGASPNWNAA